MRPRATPSRPRPLVAPLWQARRSRAGADPNLLVVRFDGAGNFVWQRVGGPGFGSAQDVAVGPTGNVHVTGNVLAEGDAAGGNAFVWTL